MEAPVGYTGNTNPLTNFSYINFSTNIYSLFPSTSATIYQWNMYSQDNPSIAKAQASSLIGEDFSIIYDSQGP